MGIACNLYKMLIQSAKLWPLWAGLEPTITNVQFYKQLNHQINAI